MKISLTEPTSNRYIYFNPTTNHMHLLVSFIEGQDISTANTCKVDERLKLFFEGDAVNELQAYKNTLEFHISLLDENNTLRQAKKQRLTQINTYLEAILAMRNDYMHVVNRFRAQPSNLYSIQLRPRVQDSYSKVVNPVFTINRGNDSRGTPLSTLYNNMHDAYPKLNLETTDITTKILKSLPTNPSFDDIKQALKNKWNELVELGKTGDIRINFDSHLNTPVNKMYVDEAMGFDNETTPGEYIDALFYLCAPNIWASMPGSPFYLGTSSDKAVTVERLSIVTQFYLGVLNVHCRIKGISNQNFGAILDDSPELSKKLVGVVSQALTLGKDVEDAIVTFFNAHKKVFQLSGDLSTQDNNGIPNDKDTIQHKFELTYKTITATKENQHTDDFILLDRDATGKGAPFLAHEGLIYMDFAHIAPTKGPNQSYFAEIREEAEQRPKLITSQNEPIITVDIEPDALMDKISDVQWDKLPKEVADACCASPAFKVRQLLDDVAKGKQNEANALLQASDDMQTLLRTPGKFTDYSGRTFKCTAYEYAYWAKDTHMCRMLERHMDTQTKVLLLEKVEEMERSGLAYEQHGVSFKNPHYDMSFVLKNLNPNEFNQLKAMVGQNNSKIQQATAENYKTIPFTATEYEALKTALDQHRPWYNIPFFYTPPAKAIGDKLQFDFHSLITALGSCANNYRNWDYHQRIAIWLKIGRAQRDVPAHVAQEYCRPDQSFDLNAYKNAREPRFKEKALPRLFTCNTLFNINPWFPLTSSSSDLGFDYCLVRGGRDGVVYRCQIGGIRGAHELALLDFAAISHLDEVRTADLTQSREILGMASPNHGLQLSK